MFEAARYILTGWYFDTGRVPTILLFKLIGVNMMGFMGLFPEIWTQLGVIIPVYVVRTAIINSAYPLQKSILMDYVPKVASATSQSNSMRRLYQTNKVNDRLGGFSVLS